MKKIYLFLILCCTCTPSFATTFYNKTSAALQTTGNWGTNVDGTGTAPTNFTTTGDIFIVRNGTTGSIGAAWALAGVVLQVGNDTSAATFTVPSGFSVGATVTVNVMAGATLAITNTTIPTLGTLSATSTVVYNTAGQTITSKTYGNLKTGHSASTITAGGALTVNGTLTTTSGGTLAMGTFQLLGTISTITNPGIISTTCTLNPALPAGKDWSTGASTVLFSASGGGQYIPGGIYKTLTCSNTSGTNTAVGNLTVGTFTTSGSGGTLDMGTFALIPSTALTNTGTLKTQNTSASPIGSLSPIVGTVIYNAPTGGQTILPKTYTNLTIANTSGTDTASGNIVVSGIFADSAGGTLDMTAAYTLTGGLTTITNNGTFKTSFLTTAPFVTGKTWGGTGKIIYGSATGGQLVMPGTYNCRLQMLNTTGTNSVTGSAILTVNDSLLIPSTGTLDITGAAAQLLGTIKLPTTNGTIRTASTGNPALQSGITWTGPIVFSKLAGAQFIPAGTFGDLTLANTSATNTAVGAVTVNGAFTTTASGTLAMGTNQLLGSMSSVTMAGILTTSCTATPAIPAGKTWGGTVTFGALTGGQSIPGGTYTTLTCTNTSGTNTAAGNIIATTITANGAGGTLDMGTNTLAATTVTNNATGTIATQNLSATPLPSGKTILGTVNYNAATGGQTIVSETAYSTLTLSNTSGTDTASGNIAMAATGAINTTAGGTFDLKSAYTLTIGSSTVITNNGTIKTSFPTSAPFTTGKTWGGTGKVIYASTTGGQAIAFGTYNCALQFNNTTGTNTVGGALIANDSLIIPAGGTTNFSVAAAALSGTTKLSCNGNITTASTTNPALPTGKIWGGSVTYSVAAGGQFIPSGTYNDLTFGNTSGTSTAQGDITVNGALTTSGGTLAMGTNQLNGSPTSITHSGTLTTSCTSNPAIPAGGTWTSGTTAQVTFNATGGGQYIPAGTYKSLTSSNTSGVNTAVGDISVINTFSTAASGGTLDMSTYAILSATTITNNGAGTIKTQNTSSAPFPANKTIAGTVIYNAATGGQKIMGGSGSYANLVLGNTSGIDSATGNLSISSSFIDSAGGTLEMTSAYTLGGSYSTVIHNGTIRTGVLTTTSATPINATKNWSGNSSPSTSRIIYTSTTGGQTIMAGTYNALVMTNTSGTNTSSGNVTVNDSLVLPLGGTFDFPGSATALIGSTLKPGVLGTISTQSTFFPAIPAGKTWGGTIAFTRAVGVQTIPAGTFNNLTFGNILNNDIINGDLTVNGTLTTTNGGGVDMGVYQLLNTTNVVNNGSFTTECTTIPAYPTGLNWTGTGGRGLVVFGATSGGQQIPDGTYKKIQLLATSGTVTTATNLYIGDSLFTTTGGTLSMGSYTLSGGSSFVTTGSGTIQTANTSSTPVKTGVLWTQAIEYNNATGGQTIVPGTYQGGLTNSNTSGVNTISSASVQITGNLTLTAGSILSDNNFTLHVGRNIEGTGTINLSSGGIVMDSAATTISGATLGNLTLNNAGGFSLTGDATINGTLTLSAGLLNLANSNLTLSASTPAVAGTPSGANMIITKGTGELRKVFTANGSYFYPLGDSLGNYTPVTLNFTSGTYAGGAYGGVKLVNGKPAFNYNTTNYINRYWGISVSGITSPLYNIVNAGYLVSDVVGTEGNIQKALYNGATPWVRYDTVNATTHSINLSNLSNTMTYVTGISDANPTASVNPVVAAICSGSGASLTAVGSGDAPFTYSWTPSASLSASTGATVTASPVNATTVDATYTYSVTASDGNGFTANSTIVVTVTATADAGTISGGNGVCQGATLPLSSNMLGGTWLSTDTTVVTVSGSGVVTGVGADMSANILYINSGVCNSDTAVNTVGVGTLAHAGTLSGATSVCESDTTSLNSTIPGGKWLSTNPANVTVDNNGLLTGVAGTTLTNILYIDSTACNSDTAIASVTVNRQGHAGSLSGGTAVCNGTTIALHSTEPGGSWLSSDPTIATVGSTGVVTGVMSGSSTDILYIDSAICSSDTAIVNIAVGTPADAGSITGEAPVCESATISLGATMPAGQWQSADSTVATVDTNGTVTGVAGGTSVDIWYIASTSCNSDTAVASILVNRIAHAGVISGATSICQLSSTDLNSTYPGGLWWSSDTTIAKVDTSGLVSGVMGDTSTIIHYVVTTACNSDSTQVTVTVNPLPSIGTISYTNNHQLCPGASSLYVGSLPGGVWSTTDTSLATINDTGLATGVSAGSLLISYTFTNEFGCVRARTTGLTVQPIPTVPNIVTGAGVVCASDTLTYYDTTIGGSHVWAVANTAVATINPDNGLLTGVAAGSTTVTYNYTRLGCSNYATATISVNPVTVATVTGTATLCASGGTTTLNATPSGGTWSSTPTAKATVDAMTGVVTGVASGTATVTYSSVNELGCTGRTYTIVTVNALPTVAAIGGASALCAAATTTLTDATTGGNWSNGGSTVASINVTSGLVTGLSGGVALISYSYTDMNGCTRRVTKNVTVNSLPAVAAITGTGTICPGATLALSDATAGTHSWVSGNTAVATVNVSTGLVTGVSGGTAMITYNYISSCNNYATTVVTVSPAVTPTVTGTPSVCIGSTTTLDATPAGGTWTSSTPARATVGSSDGIVTGIASGTLTISYVYTNESGCISSRYTVVTVNSLPSVAAIGGSASVCVASTITLTDATAGGIWTSSNSSLATVGTTGIVTGVAAGAPSISYTVTNVSGCSKTATKTITVNALPSVSAIGAGSGHVCTSGTLALTEATTGTHTWTSSTPLAATVNSSSGLVTGVAAGTAIITYSYTLVCTNRATTTITVDPVTTVAPITGASTVVIGATIDLADVTTGGVWTSSNTSRATVGSASGVVTGVGAGAVNITYTVTGCGTAFATRAISVTTSRPSGLAGEPDMVLSVYPNPTTGAFTVRTPGPGTFEVFTVDGRAIARYVTDYGINTLELPAGTASGAYMCRYTGDDGNTTIVRLVYNP